MEYRGTGSLLAGRARAFISDVAACVAKGAPPHGVGHTTWGREGKGEQFSSQSRRCPLASASQGRSTTKAPSRFLPAKYTARQHKDDVRHPDQAAPAPICLSPPPPAPSPSRPLTVRDAQRRLSRAHSRQASMGGRLAEAALSLPGLRAALPRPQPPASSGAPPRARAPQEIPNLLLRCLR